MTQQPLHHKVVIPEIEKRLPPEQVKAAAERRRRNVPDTQEVFKLVQAAEARAAASQPSSGERLRAVSGMGLRDWEYYVRTFIRVYGLDDAQQATGWSILRELQGWRDAYEESHRDEFTAARNTQDSRRRLERVSELSEPIRKMFDELKVRLDRIPTVAQREAVVKADTERGGELTTRPAEVASRPALR